MNFYYDLLSRFYKDFPELTFQNKGYEYLHPEVKERHVAQIKAISDILAIHVEGFVRFDNFKIDSKDGVLIRCQYRWSRFFTGVGYFPLENFKEQTFKLLINNGTKENQVE